MGAKKRKKEPGLLAENRKARFHYHILETLECGLELRGTEVKSMKAGKFSFPDAFIEVRNSEFYIRNLHISLYDFGNIHNHVPDRLRRLLAHRQEIEKWHRKVKERGFTIVPMKFYLKTGLVKTEIALVQGKRLYDKREAIKQRDLTRETKRALKNQKME